MRELSTLEEKIVTECLRDYMRMVEVGMSLRFPLEAERTRVLASLRVLLATLTPTEEQSSGDTTGHTSRPDSLAGRDYAAGDDADGPRAVDRGYSREGADTANRRDDAAGWEIQDQMGSEENPGSSIDEQADDSSDDTR